MDGGRKKKRARSAYIFYVMENRPKIVKKNPNLSAQAIIKVLARQWNKLTTAQKAPYVKKSEAEKRRLQRRK